MDSKAITKARSRLRVAQKALDELPQCTDYQTFTDTWYTFLVAAKNVYTVLQQGSKVSPQSKQWFGAKQQFRKNDELLQYLFQSRNDDEHGLEEVTRLKPGSIAVGVAQPGFSNSMTLTNIRFENGNLSIGSMESHDGKPILTQVTQPQAVLAGVNGPGPVTFPPPTYHLGSAIGDMSPLGVGRLGFTYLTSLVDEAGTLA
jgi:hypothetical protein